MNVNYTTNKGKVLLTMTWCVSEENKEKEMNKFHGKKVTLEKILSNM